MDANFTPGFDLPSWLQFVLTVVGGWITGVGTVVWIFWQRLAKFEKHADERLQSIEQTLYGRGTTPGGLVLQVSHAEKGIDRIEKLLVRLCEHLKIAVEL